MNIQLQNAKPNRQLKPNNFVEATVDLAECYRNALAGGAEGDDPKIRAWVDASRSVKSFFKKYQEESNKANLVQNLEKIGSKQILAEALDGLKRAEPFIDAWSKRFKLLDVPAFKDFQEFHWDIFLDYIIPLTWDWESDLFIIQNQELVLIEKLIARGQQRIIIIEPKKNRQKKIKSLLEGLDSVKHVNYRQNVHVVTSKDVISQIISVWIDHPPHVSRVISSKLSPKEGAEKAELESLQEVARQGMMNAITYDTTIKSHDNTWIKNGIGNFDSLLNLANIGCMVDKFKGFSAVIVSPGPSLEKNIDELRNLKDKAIIIAVSHSLEFLKSKNIIPDVILHVDPNVSIERYFKDFKFDDVELMILSATTAPDLFRFPVKNKAWIYANAYFDSWLMELVGLEDYTLWGSCVSVAALKLVYTLGFEKVALIGQDLSFPPGKYYAGSTYAPAGIIEMFTDSERNQEFFLPGYYGGEVLTKNDYRVYHGQFQDIANQIKRRKDNIKLYNCTEGGANIKGFKNCSLKDFISKRLSNVDSAKRASFSKILSKSLLETVDKVKARNNIIKTKRHLTEAERLIRAALSKADLGVEGASASSLGVLQKKVAKKIKASLFLKIALQDALYEISRDEGYSYNQKGYLEKGSKMYRACLSVIKELRVELNKLNLR